MPSGRLPFQVTDEMRLRVEEYVSCGMTQEQIAKALGCDCDTLRKHCHDELVNGRARRRAEVVEMIFGTARKGNVTAQKKLEEMTAVYAEPEDNQPAKSEPKLGKKEIAQLEAERAGTGTEWGHLVN